MADKTNLDKQIEVTLKANLSSFKPSDDLIAKTLVRLEQEKSSATITPMPVRRKKFPVAIISTIAASIIAVGGGLLIFNSLTAGKSESKSATTAMVDSAEVHSTYITEAAAMEETYYYITDNDAEVAVEMPDSVAEDSAMVFYPREIKTLSSTQADRLFSSLNKVNTTYTVGGYGVFTSTSNPYFQKNTGRIFPDATADINPYVLIGNDKESDLLAKMSSHKTII